MKAFMVKTNRVRANARVGAMYSIPIDQLSNEALQEEKLRLTIQSRTSFGKPPPPFEAFLVNDTTFYIPRYYGLKRYGTPEFDDRTEGEPASDLMTFQGELNETQMNAHRIVHERHYHRGGSNGTLVSLPCGGGKTVYAIYESCHYKRRTFVLVHKSVIRDQWKESFERFCPGIRVGIVQGQTWQLEPEYDVVIGMVMTIAKRDIPSSTFDSFGMVICDEAHHMAAPIMSLALLKFNAMRRLALTATKERPDGLTPMLHWSLGDEGFRAERTSESVCVSIAMFKGATREIATRDGSRPLVAAMLNNIARHVGRNTFITDRILQYRALGRVIMVLSDRIAQLDLLKEMVVQRGIDEETVGVFKGGLRDDERVRQLARPIVMCSYGMANEGVDKREADTCILATPKGRVIQAVGRIQRPCENKLTPLVLDIVDDVSVFPSMRWTRQRMYTKEGYQVQVLPASANASQWTT